LDKKKSTALREELRKIPTDKLLASIENDLRQAMQDKPVIVAARKAKKA
jgi:hypothetical protein